jgi:glutaredoxin
MILPDHTCPYGVMCVKMLEAAGVEFDDRVLRSRPEVDAFEAEHGVDTTPQTFIDDKRIGGTEALEQWLETQPA